MEMVYEYDGTPEGFFSLMDRVIDAGGAATFRARRRTVPDASGQGDLFSAPGQGDPLPAPPGAPSKDPPPEKPGSAQALLAELSLDAYCDCVLALMSEAPVERAVLGFARRVIAAAKGSGAGPGTEAARRAAAGAAGDRGDGDVRLVRETAYKVRREIHRMEGFLRFRPEGGVYVARCAPDYAILPALAEHFGLRFGEIPWAVIDEKRGLALLGPPGAEPRLVPAAELRNPGAVAGTRPDSGPDQRPGPAEGEGRDFSGELWRIYHRAANNEARQNPGLQKQFMPARYWKYITEMSGERPGRRPDPAGAAPPGG